MEEFILIWLALCIVIGVWSRSRGLSFLSGFIWSFIFSPVVGGLVTLVRKPNREKQEYLAVQGGMKKCPRCAELVKTEARVCRFCNAEFDG